MQKQGDKIFKQNLSNGYTLTWENGIPKLLIHNDGEGKECVYLFNSEVERERVTGDILEKALKETVSKDFATFEIIYLGLKNLIKSEELCKVAAKLFKEHFNFLYNSIIADDILGRRRTFDNLDEVYDFFDGNE